MSFSAGAALPIIAIVLVSQQYLIPAVVATSLIALVLLGCISAHLGRTPKLRGASRILFWGAIAMSISIGVGHWFNIAG